MDKQARGELLRQRHRAKTGPRPLPEHRERNPLTKPTGRGWFNWPTNYAPGEPTREMDVRWVEQPDELQPVTVRPKRTKRESALTKIAKQSGRKLVRTYRNAEAFAASRARR